MLAVLFPTAVAPAPAVEEAPAPEVQAEQEAEVQAEEEAAMEVGWSKSLVCCKLDGKITGAR